MGSDPVPVDSRQVKPDAVDDAHGTEVVPRQATARLNAPEGAWE